MNTRLHILTVTLVLCLTGCIAGPTPHPGTENATDQLGPPAQPVPTTGAAEKCTDGGGDWNGVSCDETSQTPEDSSDAALAAGDASTSDAAEVADDDAMDGDGADDDAVDAGPMSLDAAPDSD